MVTHADRDVPRLPGPSHTAIIGDPRNDENLVVVQFHHAMLRFHNAVVDLLLASGFTGDIFIEAKRIVTHHYQWAVVHDFLDRRVRDHRGERRVGQRQRTDQQPVPDAGRVLRRRLPVRAQHDPRQVLGELQLPVNATAVRALRIQPQPAPARVDRTGSSTSTPSSPTGVPVPVFNQARKIDTALANGLTALPGFTGLMAELAKRNLLRGLALGLPSGQGMARRARRHAADRRRPDAGLPADELDRTERWRRSAAGPHPAVVLRPARGGGPTKRRPARASRRPHRRRDVRPDPETRPRLVPQRHRRLHPVPAIGDRRTFTFTDLLAFSGMNMP